MAITRRAHISWSAEQRRIGLPVTTESVDPAWLTGGGDRTADGWSLVCRFDVSPREQGSPSVASVHFLMPDAPHERLVPGAVLELFERDTGARAVVSVAE